MPFDTFNQWLEDIKDSPISVLFEKGEELRNRLIKIFLGLILLFGIFFYFSEELLVLLQDPLKQYLSKEASRLYYKDPLEGFAVTIKISLLASATLILPFAFWQILKFIEPAIPNEHRRLIKPYYAATLILFFLGGSFCFFLILPQAMKFLVEMGTEVAEPMLMIGEYISVIGWMMFGFGLVFQLPVILILLAQLGLVSSAFLKDSRKIALIINLAVAAILTPTPDPFSQIAMAIPMGILYEIAILMIIRIEKSTGAQSPT